MKTIQVTEEGKLFLSGVEIDDLNFCSSFLKTLKNEEHICFGEWEGEKIFTEAKSFPLVVQEVEIKKGNLLLKFNYGVSESFSFEADKGLYLDDWSRICGLSETNVPFIFSSKAQEVFLKEQVEAFDYDSLKFNGKDFEIKDWYLENMETLNKKFWSQKYQDQNTGWDLGEGHPCIDETISRLKLQKSKILVPGCGRGHDVAKFFAKGHNVKGLDMSEVAIKEAQQQYPRCEFIHGNIFEYSKSHVESYDLVFEHTLFCALNPSERIKLIKSWKNLLRPGGSLVGVFMGAYKRGGPPFGVTEWELEELLAPHFRIDYWGRLRGKETARPGKEFFVFAERK